MSTYPHGYTLSPARPSGWGSVFAGVVTVIAVVAVSAMSGALVMAELVGKRPDASAASTAPAAMSAIEIPNVRQAAAPQAAPAEPTKSRPADKRVAALPTPAPAAKPVAAPAPAPAPVVAAAPQAAPAAQAPGAAPAPNAAQVATVPDSELTFTKGYAQRRAAQTAAEQSAPQQTAHAAADHQFGRPAVTQRKPAYARVQEQRRYVARDSREQYYRDHEYRDREARDRDHYDYRRDRAMAYGDQYQGRRSNGSQGGMFGNLFGGGNLF